MSAAPSSAREGAGAERSWSLARRLTVWFTITTLVLGAVVLTCGTLFLRHAIGRELDGLAAEEFDELRAYFAKQRASAETLRPVAAELASHHPEHEITFGAWSRATGELVAKIGDAPLPVQSMPSPMPGRRVQVLDDGRRWRVEEIGGDLIVGMSLGGGPQTALLRRFTLLLVVFVVVAASVAMLAGSLFGRRVARELRRIADEARAVHSPVAQLAGSQGAPEEIREVAEALREMLTNIHAQAERVRIVTAGMAHELRSPIQNLLGETEVALLRERDGEYYRGVLQKNLDELRDLARAVDNLVTLCGAGEGRRARALERFDLGREAELRLVRERQQAERRGVRLELEASGDLTVQGDREALLLALRNLVSNAIDWSPPGGVVRVELSGRADEDAQGRQAALELAVDDMGPGVPADERQAIFEPFRRGRAAAGRRIGYGLGLALVRSAVEGQGGSVDVVRSAAGGARFRVRIPRGLDGAA